jgi:sugar/nucleoside kinase (ribokinase family)
MATTKLGLKTAIYAETGDDEEAERIIGELDEAGVVTEHVHKNENSQTGVNPVIVFKGERTIFSHHEVRPYQMRGWPKPKWIYYTSVNPGFKPFQAELVEYIKQNPDVGVAFNPGTFHMKAGLEELRNILEVSHVLFLNKDEANRFVGLGSLEEVHSKLQKLGPKLTVITEAKKGSSAHDGNRLVQIPAYEMDEPVIDKTGAGDSFASGFVSALFYGKSMEEALWWGAINSSHVIRKIGAVHGLISKKEMEKLVEQCL